MLCHAGAGSGTSGDDATDLAGESSEAASARHEDTGEGAGAATGILAGVISGVVGVGALAAAVVVARRRGRRRVANGWAHAYAQEGEEDRQGRDGEISSREERGSAGMGPSVGGVGTSESDAVRVTGTATAVRDGRGRVAALFGGSSAVVPVGSCVTTAGEVEVRRLVKDYSQSEGDWSGGRSLWLV